jgi:hypothetical protein
MLTNIDIDEELIAEAMRISGARTKREAVDRALRDLVARGKRTRVRDFLAIAELGGIDPDYDPKDLTARGDQVGRWRVEQPIAHYKPKPPASPAPSPARTKKR